MLQSTYLSMHIIRFRQVFQKLKIHKIDFLIQSFPNCCRYVLQLVCLFLYLYGSQNHLHELPAFIAKSTFCYCMKRDFVNPSVILGGISGQNYPSKPQTSLAVKFVEILDQIILFFQKFQKHGSDTREDHKGAE